MSIIVNRDTLETVYLPSAESESKDAVDKLIASVKGALCISVDENNEWLVLVDDGEKFYWVNIVDCLPSTSTRSYNLGAKVTPLSSSPKSTP